MKLSVFLVFLLLCVLVSETAKSKGNRRNKGVQLQRQQRQKQQLRQQQQQAPRQQRQAQGQRGQKGQRGQQGQKRSRAQPKRKQQRSNSRRRKNNNRRRPRVGPPGFDLPDLKKLPNTKFDCDETHRQSNQEKAFCRLRNKCLKKFSDSKTGGGPTLHQRMEICNSQAHLQMLTTKIENVA